TTTLGGTTTTLGGTTTTLGGTTTTLGGTTTTLGGTTTTSRGTTTTSLHPTTTTTVRPQNFLCQILESALRFLPIPALRAVIRVLLRIFGCRNPQG
ncbi:MAG TPA: hypothetical protein VHT30_01240, partial [Acidimicrobiales bacterium]|nr:hypothetical protein [Acidimicrobiales bacterium]